MTWEAQLAGAISSLIFVVLNCAGAPAGLLGSTLPCKWPLDHQMEVLGFLKGPRELATYDASVFLTLV